MFGQRTEGLRPSGPAVEDLLDRPEDPQTVAQGQALEFEAQEAQRLAVAAHPMESRGLEGPAAVGAPGGTSFLPDDARPGCFGVWGRIATARGHGAGRGVALGADVAGVVGPFGNAATGSSAGWGSVSEVGDHLGPPGRFRVADVGVGVGGRVKERLAPTPQVPGNRQNSPDFGRPGDRAVGYHLEWQAKSTARLEGEGMSNPKDDVARILSDLTVLRQLRGCQKVDRKLGRSSSQVRRLLTGQVGLKVGDFFRLLDVMDIDRQEFFAWSEAGFYPEVYLRELEKKNEDQARYMTRTQLAKPPEKEYSDREIREKAEGLEEGRLLDMEAAWRDALEVLRSAQLRAVEPQHECEAWGIAGSIQRDRGRYSSSAYCLRRALVIPGVDRTPTLRRVAKLLSDQGEFGDALKVLDVAMRMGVAARDWPGVSRTLISEGALRSNTGEPIKATGAYETSLVLLPADEWHGRFSALQGLGLCWIHRGDIDKALEYLEEALGLLEDVGTPPLIRSWALWPKAEIHLYRQELKPAETDFSNLKQIYTDASMSALDVALASLRLAKVLFLAGKHSAVWSLTKEMLSLLERLQKENKLLAGAFAQFLRLAMGGNLTADLLEKIYRVMRKGAKKAPPLLQVP